MMKFVNGEELYSRLKKQAFNSSHYVWLWSDLKFLESSNGWIFGVTKELGVNLVALEPLPPLNKASDEESFAHALEDLQSFFQGGPIAFVGIYTPFAKTLSQFGFSSFQIGKEPWVNLSDIKPTGHAGRKVRVGRNQALKSGLRVEEWNLVEVIKDPAKLSALNEVKTLWEAQSFVSLSGFLHGMSFECIPQDRKCFVALTKENVIDGILIVTPIANEKSWYFEDLLIRTTSSATKGIGELLTLSAMEALQAIGHEEISLGIVPMTSVGVCEFGEAPPTNFLRLTKFFQSSMGMFYNAEGMELFRKRFKVVRWDKIYLSILTDKKSKKPETIQWINVLLAITAAYKPSLQLEPSYIAEKVLSPIKRYPTTFSFLFLSIVSFLVTTQIPALSHFIVQNLEFSKNAGLWQWPLRTITSELIYFNPLQFGVLFSLITLLLFHIEKEVFDKKWAGYLLGFFVLSDIVARTTSGLIYNFIYPSDSLLTLLNLFPTNGGGVLLASMLGFAITLSGQKKDEWFAMGLLGFITLSFILPSFGVTSLALLDSTTFYIEGYLVGKFYLNYQSQKDALINKNKNEDDDSLDIQVPAKGQQTGRQKGNQKKGNVQNPNPENELVDDALATKSV
ncbi:MAG: phosphatidylglycerol lysyltransferase domain-containing protein [Bacteriovorax sp.]